MTAYGHVIYVERRVANPVVNVNGGLSHFDVGTGPATGKSRKAVTNRFIIVTEIRVRPVTVVIGVGVVVVSVGAVPDFFHLVAECKRLIGVGTVLKTTRRVIKVSGDVGIFAGGGTSAPKRVIIVFKNKALRRHFI